MSNEEVKEEVKKVPEEVGEVSKTEAEEVQKVNKEVPEEVQAVDKESKTKKKRNFVNITRLKCNYTVYKRERTACKMKVTTNCSKCHKTFKDGDALYSAYIENDNTKQNYLICEKCAKEN